MYHSPQILQDVAKLRFLNCLPSTLILSSAPQDLLLPGLRTGLLDWPWPHTQILDSQSMSPAEVTFAPCLYVNTLKIQSPFTFSEDSYVLSYLPWMQGLSAGSFSFSASIKSQVQSKANIDSGFALSFTLCVVSCALKFWFSKTLSSVQHIVPVILFDSRRLQKANTKPKTALLLSTVHCDRACLREEFHIHSSSSSVMSVSLSKP